MPPFGPWEAYFSFLPNRTTSECRSEGCLDVLPGFHYHNRVPTLISDNLIYNFYIYSSILFILATCLFLWTFSQGNTTVVGFKSYFVLCVRAFPTLVKFHLQNFSKQVWVSSPPIAQMVLSWMLRPFNMVLELGFGRLFGQDSIPLAIDSPLFVPKLYRF